MADQDQPLQPPSVLWILKQSMIYAVNPWTLTIPDVDLRGKNVLVSGANNGVGREAALRFAKWGANLVLACRKDVPHNEQQPAAVVQECQSLSRLAGHSEANIEWWEVDMADLASVEALATRWNDTGRPLDILANNAGISPPRQPGKTKDGFELLHQINLLSHVLMTMSLLPSIAKAEHPRIVCTTSSMHYNGKFNLSNANSGVNSYANNKLYFQVWLTELQRRMLNEPKYKHIAIHGVHPGYTKTGIWASAKGLKPRNFMEWVFNIGLDYLAIDAQQGSLAILTAATGPDSALSLNDKVSPEFQGGAKFFNRTTPIEPMPHTRNAKCRLEVWDFLDSELKLRERKAVSGEVKSVFF